MQLCEKLLLAAFTASIVHSAERVRTTLSPAVLAIQGACFPEKGASKDPYMVCNCVVRTRTFARFALTHCMWQPGIQNLVGAHE
jgi:hypothetical protein|eukprot:COSAG01_NODE_87_length_27454_cov_201.243575_7_plen_84_part_00